MSSNVVSVPLAFSIRIPETRSVKAHAAQATARVRTSFPATESIVAPIPTTLRKGSSVMKRMAPIARPIGRTASRTLPGDGSAMCLRKRRRTIGRRPNREA